MNKRHYFKLLQVIVVGFAGILVMGCAQRRYSTAPPASVTTVNATSRTMTVQAPPQRYYRDDSGTLYLVDANGNLRIIQRRVRVEPGASGVYAIIDENNVRYHHDENGRLYYRSDTGGILYVEEHVPGKVIDPIPLLQGRYSTPSSKLRTVEYCNAEWNTCSNHCNDSPGMTNKRDCLGECDYQREQCLQPY